MKIDIYIKTRPISVEYECPMCESDNIIKYHEFEDEHGASCDWKYEKIVCPACGAILEIEDIDWG